jgi:hypothetical protein
MHSFFQPITDAIHQLTALLHNAVVPLMKELTFDAFTVGGFVAAWRRVFRPKRPRPKPPPEDETD